MDVRGPFPFGSPEQVVVSPMLAAATKAALSGARTMTAWLAGDAGLGFATRTCTPEELAAAAVQASRELNLPIVDRARLRVLRQWWVTCAEEGWFEFHRIDDAFVALARLTSDSPAAAAELLALIRSRLQYPPAKAG